MKKVLESLSLFLIVAFITTAAFAQDHDMNNMGGNKTANKTMTEDQKLAKGGMKMDMMQMDRHFIEKMIPHHQAAIDMGKLALKKTKRPEIKKLAQDIIATQTVEIETMKKWYKEWFGTDVPVEPMNMQDKSKGMNDQGLMMMDMCMNKNMTAGSRDDLKKASDFDKEFLKMMIKHHKMAVMMSGMIVDSKKPEMRKLGRDIAVAQAEEIEKMINWQSDWHKADDIK